MWRVCCSSLVANDIFIAGARHAILSNSVLPVFLYLKPFRWRFFIWFALKNYLHCVSYGLQCITCVALYLDMALYWSVLGSRLRPLVCPYKVSQIKLLCRDTTKMPLCLWHLCSACQKHLFNWHFFLLNIHYLETAHLPFNSGFDKVKNIASGGSEALFIVESFAFVVHKAANSYPGKTAMFVINTVRAKVCQLPSSLWWVVQ